MQRPLVAQPSRPAGRLPPCRLMGERLGFLFFAPDFLSLAFSIPRLSSPSVRTEHTHTCSLLYNCNYHFLFATRRSRFFPVLSADGKKVAEIHVHIAFRPHVGATTAADKWPTAHLGSSSRVSPRPTAVCHLYNLFTPIGTMHSQRNHD